ncbi:LemA family protein [Candidatus Poribacteria bacterium]|nr:LemA family protein [Candidatus Poribacteria bacterium]
MKWALVALGVLVLISVLFAGSLLSTYNGFVAKQEQVSSQVGQLQNVLQRRADLIPNLVEVVKGYASHESETLEAVVQARANATRPQINVKDAKSVNDFIAAQDQFSSAIARLMVVVENYPQLKADTQFSRLMDELAGTENRISVERKRYNDVARDYNTAIRRFPGAIVANLTGFDAFAYFEASPDSQTAPKVTF